MSKATAARTRAWGFRRGRPLRRGAPFHMEPTSPRNNAIQCEQPPMSDMNNIKKLARIAPDAMRGFEAFEVAAFKKGAIPRKYKELMALAIALTTQCPYCLQDSQKCGHQRGRHERRVGGDYRVDLARRCCHYARYAPDGRKLTAPRRGHLGLKKDPSRMAHSKRVGSASAAWAGMQRRTVVVSFSEFLNALPQSRTLDNGRTSPSSAPCRGATGKHQFIKRDEKGRSGPRPIGTTRGFTPPTSPLCNQTRHLNSA